MLEAEKKGCRVKVEGDSMSGDIALNADGEIVDVICARGIFSSDSMESFARAFLREALGRIPEQQRIPPPVSVAGRVLEVARWHDSCDPLSEMFSALLTKACDKNAWHTANPAYVEILRQLSPDEARLLYWIAKRKVLLREGSWFKTTEHMRLSFSEHGTEIICHEMPYWLLANPAALTTGAYLGHLQHMGLIGYNVLATYNSGQRKVKDLQVVFTQYGAMFVEACLPQGPFQSFNENIDWDEGPQ